MLNHKPKIHIFIPAYNAQNHLEKVLDRMDEACWQRVSQLVVINDGSSDDTAKVISSLENKYPKLQCLENPKNLGYGETVKIGLKSALDGEGDYIVCLHADGQYPPEYILEMVDFAEEHKLDIVQGSRMKGKMALQGGMPLYKYVAGKILCLLENWVFKLSLSDYHSGFLCYSKKTLQVIPFKSLSHSFDFDLEMIAAARKNGLSIGEIGIPTRYADEESHLSPIGYGIRVLKVLWGYVFFGNKYLKYGPP